MSHAAVRMHERQSFGSTYASALMMTNPTMNSRRNQLIDLPSIERQKKESPAKKTDGRFPKLVQQGETLLTHA